MEDNYKILEHPEGKVDLVNANIKKLEKMTFDLKMFKYFILMILLLFAS